MKKKRPESQSSLPEHFFRNEYGKIVAFLTRYVGVLHIADAEDVAQETFLKAVENWTHQSLPPNPQAWLYTTARNLMLNRLKRKKHLEAYLLKKSDELNELREYDFNMPNEIIADEQLKMMFVCCNDFLSQHQQIVLILKTLCGFSIVEIASAFLSTKETINKRLVRARHRLKEARATFELPPDIDRSLPVILKTIYLLFNEGYKSTNNSSLIRRDLCLEAIRLTQLLIQNDKVKQKSDCHALAALMLLNVSRFEARQDKNGQIVEMEKQDRSLWNQELIREGLRNLTLASEFDNVSRYLLLATISANHCVAPSFSETNWEEILDLYDKLLTLEDSALIRLNRAVVISKVHGVSIAIDELRELARETDIAGNYLFHATMGELLIQSGEPNSAKKSIQKAISLSSGEPESDFLKKKLRRIVPVC